MLEQYFSKPDTVDRIRDCWLGEPIERYVAWLSSQGYAASNIHSRVPVLRRFAAFVWSRGGRSFEELPDHVEPFVSDWVTLSYRKTRRRRPYNLAEERKVT